eukprot:446469-Rhodomonas_salina.2
MSLTFAVALRWAAGLNGGVRLGTGEIYILDVHTLHWTMVEPGNSEFGPGPISGHCMGFASRKLFLYGSDGAQAYPGSSVQETELITRVASRLTRGRRAVLHLRHCLERLGNVVRRCGTRAEAVGANSNAQQRPNLHLWRRWSSPLAPSILPPSTRHAEPSRQ